MVAHPELEEDVLEGEVVVPVGLLVIDTEYTGVAGACAAGVVAPTTTTTDVEGSAEEED